MGEYFGFNIGEREDGDWGGYLGDIDPKYHVAITRAMSNMCNWYGDKDYRQVDDWFTILYGLILELEDVLENKWDGLKSTFGISTDDMIAMPYGKPDKDTDDSESKL